MKFQSLGSVFVVVSSVFIGAATAHADPRGLWLAQDGAQVRVMSCGKALCGRIASPKSPTDPDTGQEWTDRDNPDPRLRDRPLVGVEVFISMMPDGPGTWTGQLYNTDSGQTVPGHLYEVGPQTIKIEGCLGALCGGQNLSRIR